MAIATGQMNGAEQVSVTGACQDCHIEEVLDKLEHELVGLKPVKTTREQACCYTKVKKVDRSWRPTCKL